jgi:hypothetical protein
MKYFIGIVCMFFSLFLSGCASTGSSCECVSGQERISNEPSIGVIVRAEIEAGRSTPRVSPEGMVYMKKTLTQAIEEANNPTNSGATLFFESEVYVEREDSVSQLRITESRGPSIIMWYYERDPIGIIGELHLPIILYRVIISDTGTAKYVIDSFRR